MLSHLSKRMVMLLKILASKNDYVNSDTLSIQLGVTSRTIREDIKKLNHTIRDFDLKISSKRGIGFKLSCQSLDNLYYLLNQVDEANKALDINPITPEDRVRFIIKKLIYSTHGIKIEKIIDELYVSESTVKKDIQKAKNILNKYNIRIVKTNQGIHVEGHEINKRFCISDYLIYHNKVEEDIVINFINSNSHHVSANDIEKIKKIILYYLNEENMVISDAILDKIAIHIAIAISRIKTNQYIRLNSDKLNSLTTESEYNVSAKIVRSIGELFNISFSDDEIAYTTMHLVGNRISQKEMDVPANLLAYLGEDIYQLSLNIIEETSVKIKEINLKEDKELLYDLGLHLKQLVKRLSFNMNIRNPLLNKIKIKYPLAFEAGIISAKAITDLTGYNVNENEIGYLALHFGVAIEKQKFQALKSKKKIALVCASGMATSSLLLTKLSHKLGTDYYMIGAYALHQIDELMQQQPDIILTTVLIQRKLSVPVIKVPSLLNDVDIIDVKNSLESIDRDNFAFTQFLREDLFFANIIAETKSEVLEVLTNNLLKQGNISEKTRKSILEREYISSTAIGNMVAIPHPLEIQNDKSFVCTAILENDVSWDDNEHVLVVFIIVLEEKLQSSYADIFAKLYNIVHSEDNVLLLSKQKNFQDFIETIDSMQLGE